MPTPASPRGRLLLRRWGAALALLTAGCAGPSLPALPDGAAPPPVAPPAPSYVAPAAAPPPVRPTRPRDWRDWPLAAGSWQWREVSGGSAARFLGSDGATLVLLSCQRATASGGHGQFVIARPGTGLAPPALTVTASQAARTLFARDGVIDGAPARYAVLDPTDPLLDAVAFSRGRFSLESPGMPALTVPVWAEVERVIEDCR